MLGYDALTAALLLIPLPIVTSVVAPLSGVVADRIGARIPATVGLLIQSVALLWFTRLTPAMPYWQVAAGSLPRDVMMKLFVGTNVSLGSAPMLAFVTGMHTAFWVSIGLGRLAAAMSMVRGKENRQRQAHSFATGE